MISIKEKKQILSHSAYINPHLLVERLSKKPVNPWDFIEYKGHWYHRLSNLEGNRRSLLRSLSEEFDQVFDDFADLHTFCDETIQTGVYKCDLCGLQAKTQMAVDNHRNNRECMRRQEMQIAQKKGETYVPPSVTIQLSFASGAGSVTRVTTGIE